MIGHNTDQFYQSRHMELIETSTSVQQSQKRPKTQLWRKIKLSLSLVLKHRFSTVILALNSCFKPALGLSRASHLTGLHNSMNSILVCSAFQMFLTKQKVLWAVAYSTGGRKLPSLANLKKILAATESEKFKVKIHFDLKTNMKVCWLNLSHQT